MTNLHVSRQGLGAGTVEAHATERLWRAITGMACATALNSCARDSPVIVYYVMHCLGHCSWTLFMNVVLIIVQKKKKKKTLGNWGVTTTLPGTIKSLDAIVARSPNPLLASRNIISREFKMNLSNQYMCKCNQINWIN